MSRKRVAWRLAASLACGAVIVALGAPANAAPKGPRYCGYSTAVVVNDVAPVGESLGDERVNTYILVNKKGEKIGSAEVLATLVELGLVKRAAGRLTLNIGAKDKIFGVGESLFDKNFLDPAVRPIPVEYTTAIIGGTGAYAGASGTMTRTQPQPNVRCWEVNFS